MGLSADYMILEQNELHSCNGDLMNKKFVINSINGFFREDT